jgi:hypothetical protein
MTNFAENGEYYNSTTITLQASWGKLEMKPARSDAKWGILANERIIEYNQPTERILRNKVCISCNFLISTKSAIISCPDPSSSIRTSRYNISIF